MAELVVPTGFKYWVKCDAPDCDRQVYLGVQPIDHAAGETEAAVKTELLETLAFNQGWRVYSTTLAGGVERVRHYCRQHSPETHYKGRQIHGPGLSNGRRRKPGDPTEDVYIDIPEETVEERVVEDDSLVGRLSPLSGPRAVESLQRRGPACDEGLCGHVLHQPPAFGFGKRV